MTTAVGTSFEAVDLKSSPAELRVVHWHMQVIGPSVMTLHVEARIPRDGTCTTKSIKIETRMRREGATDIFQC